MIIVSQNIDHYYMLVFCLIVKLMMNCQTIACLTQHKLSTWKAKLTKLSVVRTHQVKKLYIHTKKNMNIYEDIIQRISNEDQDDYGGLRNDTNQVSWLSTPRINESINHIVTINPGSNGQDRYWEVDLHSQSSGNSTVYTRPTPRCKEQSSVVYRDTNTETVKHSAPIKIHYIIAEILFITLLLILLSHISCVENFRRQTGQNVTTDIFKSDNDVLLIYSHDRVPTYAQDTVSQVLTTAQEGPSSKKKENHTTPSSSSEGEKKEGHPHQRLPYPSSEGGLGEVGLPHQRSPYPSSEGG